MSYAERESDARLAEMQARAEAAEARLVQIAVKANARAKMYHKVGNDDTALFFAQIADIASGGGPA
jgi:ribosomal protein L9